MVCRNTKGLWLVWFGGLGVLPQSERSPVRFPGRARAWVAGQVPSRGACEGQQINVSLAHQCSPPSSSLSKNKQVKSWKQNKGYKGRRRNSLCLAVSGNRTLLLGQRQPEDESPLHPWGPLVPWPWPGGNGGLVPCSARRALMDEVEHDVTKARQTKTKVGSFRTHPDRTRERTRGAGRNSVPA